MKLHMPLCADRRWFTCCHAQSLSSTCTARAASNFDTLSYFGHNSLILTPIWPSFEPTGPSLPPLQEYYKKLNLPYHFCNCLEWTPEILRKLRRGSFSLDFASTFLIPFTNFSPLSQAQILHLKSLKWITNLIQRSFELKSTHGLFIDFSGQSRVATSLLLTIPLNFTYS